MPALDEAVFQLPLPNQRLAVYGPTGSGKTYLCERLLDNYDNVIKMDFKHHLNPRGGIIVDSFAKLHKELKQQDQTGRAIIYRVPREELLPENGHLLDRVPELVMRRKHTLLYYDDVVYVASSSDYTKRAPHFYYALTVGRGIGVGVWCLSQRPARIPVSVHTESDMRITFFLRRQSDRKMAEESFGNDTIPWESLRKQEFSFVAGTDRWLSPRTIKLAA